MLRKTRDGLQKKSGICPTNADDAIGCQSCSTVGDFFEKLSFLTHHIKKYKDIQRFFCAKKGLISLLKNFGEKKFCANATFVNVGLGN